MYLAFATVVSVTIYIIYKTIKKSTKNRYCGLLVIPLMFTAFAVFFGCVWFFCGKELTPQGHWLWTTLERGSLGAIETVAGVLGISNFLFGWVYAERNRLTLGKSQLELIQYQFGKLYTWGVAVHFFATALCLLLTKAGAREGAFFSFLALSSGCVPQVMICFDIGLSSKSREECALKLWNSQKVPFADHESPSVLRKMIQCLSDPDVCANRSYRDALSKKIADWVSNFPEVHKAKQRSLTEMTTDVRMISYEFHVMLETIPNLERVHFVEELFELVCRYWDDLPNSNEFCPFSRMELLCCGYVHCIYNIHKTDGTVESMERKIDALASRISSLTYYFQHQEGMTADASQFLLRLLGGLEWYLFLTERGLAPRYVTYQDNANTQGGEIFAALISAIFELDNPDGRAKNTQIAWSQV